MPFVEPVQQWLNQYLDRLDFPLSWLRNTERPFEDWRIHARGVLREALGPAPDDIDIDVQVLHQEDRGGYTATLLSLQADRECRTEAYYLVPDGEGPFPAVALLHDHGAFFAWGKEKVVASPVSEHPAIREHVGRHYGGRFVGDELARRGYAVIAVDQWLWGEKRVPHVPGASSLDLSTYEGVRAYHQLMPDFERQVSFALVFAGQSVPGHFLHLDQRALDYLCADPRIDTARLAAMGLSVGAFRTIHLAAMDDRISAAVAIGWMVALGTYLRCHDHLYRYPNTLGLCAPGLARYLDYPDLVGMACPNPFLVMAGRQDALYPIHGVEEAFAKMRAIYDAQGAGEYLSTRWYDVPHCFDVSMQEEAFSWLGHWFGADDQPQRA